MKKVKEFYKKHETKILIAGGIVLLVVAVKHRKYVKNLEEIANHYAPRYAGKKTIAWVCHGNHISFDKAKKIIDLNIDNEAMYAIVKEAKDICTVVLLNDTNVVLPV